VVHAALARVPEEFRVALVLCDLYRLPYADAAQIIEVPVGTVKSRVYRGRLALAGELEGGEAPQPPGSPGVEPVRRGLHVVGPGTGTRARASEPKEPDHPNQE
jgi:hypothetical protein